MAPAPIDYLVIGHVCIDELPAGEHLGGTAAYAALAARRLGLRVAVVTSAAEDVDLAAALPGVAIHCLPAATTTRYRHTWHGATRRLTLRARAAPLTLDAVPPAWRAPRVVHLAPIAAEVDPALARALHATFRAATVQGWLRGWDTDGQVYPLPCGDLPFLLGRVDALVASREDLAAEPWGTAPLVAASSRLALTLGAAGVAVYAPDHSQVVPACPAVAHDPTGAGDVFAAVWFARLAGGEAALTAARYAAAAAACTVERAGLAGVPTTAEIEERLAAWAR
ncbi:MAG: ribokinase [Chloroflexi bacterium]|nr:ribokinase [Chloroflexota bacterium]